MMTIGAHDRDPATIGEAARFLPAGDCGLVVEFGDVIDCALNTRIVRAAARIKRTGLPGVMSATATFRSLHVAYDPQRTSQAALRQLIGAMPLDPPAAASRRRVWTLPTLYGGAAGPDIEGVARALDADPSDIVRLHAGQVYHVYMIGFLPGFAYMGDLPAALRHPRLREPRTRVPAGSVAIAQQMTAVYPYESPGGWRLLGATAVRLFDPDAPAPSLLAAGDGVRFAPVSATEHARLAEAVGKGGFIPDCVEEPVA